jgi:hypothetical protein
MCNPTMANRSDVNIRGTSRAIAERAPGDAAMRKRKSDWLEHADNLSRLVGQESCRRQVLTTIVVVAISACCRKGLRLALTFR